MNYHFEDISIQSFAAIQNYYYNFFSLFNLQNLAESHLCTFNFDETCTTIYGTHRQWKMIYDQLNEAFYVKSIIKFLWNLHYFKI